MGTSRKWVSYPYHKNFGFFENSCNNLNTCDQSENLSILSMHTEGKEGVANSVALVQTALFDHQCSSAVSLN